MARPTDENKLINIKNAAVEVVVAEGVSGASISKIADKANVSVGYLYRFYKGKRELLEALFAERFKIINNLLKEQVETQDTVKDIVSIFTRTIFDAANTEPKTISFTHKLLSDFSFELPKKFKHEVINTCKEIILLGRKTKEIDPSITDETFYTITVGGCLNFVNIRLRKIFNEEKFTDKEIEETTSLLLKALAPTEENL